MKIKVCLVQVEPVVGSIPKNIEKIRDVIESYTADLYVFPELFLVGYTVKDAMYKLALSTSSKHVEELKKLTKRNGVGLIVGFPELTSLGYIYNSILAIDEEGNIFLYRKRHLPTFSVFDEHRWFKQYKGAIKPWNFKGIGVGLAICYDMFFPEIFKTYMLRGAKLHVVISASPDSSLPLFHTLSTARALETTSYLIWVNTVGILDGLTFAGGSRVVNPLGNIVEQLKVYEEDVKIVTIDINEVHRCRVVRPVIKDSMREDAEELLRAYNEFESLV